MAGKFAPPTPEELEEAKKTVASKFAPPTEEELSAVRQSTGEQVGRFGAGVVQGFGELVNLPAIPGTVERIGRAGATFFGGERKPNESLLGKFGRSLEEADRESLFPAPNVQETAAGIRSIPGVVASPFTGRKVEDVFAEEMQTQKEFGFTSKGGELTGTFLTAVPGIVAIGKTVMTGLKALPGIARKTGSLIADVATPAKAALTTTRGVLKEVLQQVDGEIVEAILKRPEKVKALLESNNLSVDDLAVTTGNKIEKVVNKLGERVGEFRKVVMGNDADSIPTRPFKKMVSNLERKFQQKSVSTAKDVPGTILDASGKPILTKEITTIQGKSALSRKELSELADIKGLLEKEKLSPRESLNIVDRLSALSDPALAQRGVVSNTFSFEVRALRRNLKNAIRGRSKAWKGWAKADDEFGKMKEASDPVLRKLNSDGRTSFVNNMLNKNKEPVVKRLESVLDGVSKIEGGKFDHKKLFFDNLADIRAAQGLKARELGANDPMADNIARIIKKYETRSERVGTIAGGLVGLAAGGGGGSFAGPLGTVGGAAGGSFSLGKIGQAIGGLHGRRIGEQMADPYRLLELAQKQKNLSKPLMEFIKEVLPLKKTLKIDGLLALFATMGSSRVLVELFSINDPSESDKILAVPAGRRR